MKTSSLFLSAQLFFLKRCKLLKKQFAWNKRSILICFYKNLFHNNNYKLVSSSKKKCNKQLQSSIHRALAQRCPWKFKKRAASISCFYHGFVFIRWKSCVVRLQSAICPTRQQLRRLYPLSIQPMNNDFHREGNSCNRQGYQARNETQPKMFQCQNLRSNVTVFRSLVRI